MDCIVILDFGGQTTQLIGRRIRDLGVYTLVVPGTSGPEELNSALCRQTDHSHANTPQSSHTPKGLVLSGSPHSAWKEGSPRIHPDILASGIPILAICYGFHLLTLLDKGTVKTLPTREFGPSRISVDQGNLLLEGIPPQFQSWMSHSDSIDRPGPSWTVLAHSQNGHPAIAAHRTLPFWGVQFHPEADHCEYGSHLLGTFAKRICGARPQWSLDNYLEESITRIQGQAGNRDVLLLISGGVDSAVAAALLLRALSHKKLWLMYIDTGLMRHNETDEVVSGLKELGARNLIVVNARTRFLDALAGIADPENKRLVIGDTFIQVQKEEIARHIPDNNYLLAQGTLYTDLIESGRGVGTQAKVIKSHHNVGSPLVEAKRRAGQLLEPLAELYKDEVRRLGTLLGIGDSIVNRHPFPGPGLAVRILSDVTQHRIDILRHADSVYMEELHKRSLYSQIWQAFAVLLPVRSTGVTGDTRDFGYVCALRAVNSRDGMSAEVFPFPMADLLDIAARITNEVPDIGRVVYDVSSKPPATIEWE